MIHITYYSMYYKIENTSSINVLFIVFVATINLNWFIAVSAVNSQQPEIFENIANLDLKNINHLKNL